MATMFYFINTLDLVTKINKHFRKKSKTYYSTIGGASNILSFRFQHSMYMKEIAAVPDCISLSFINSSSSVKIE